MAGVGIVVLPIVASILLNVAVGAQTPEERHWLRLGPNRISVWAFSPEVDQDDLILISTDATERQSLRGIYRSEDRGTTWTESSEGLEPRKRHYYTALSLSPGFAEDQTAWLTGQKTGLGRTEPYGGLWESTDGGNSWTEIEYEGFPFREMTQRVSQSIIGLVISSRADEDGVMVAAAGGEGVYHSSDWGRTWELLNPVKDVTGIFAPTSFPDEPFLALSTTGSRIMISEDGGRTFETRAAGLPETMTSVRGVAFSDNFAQDRTMFCFGTMGVFMSTDAGEQWTTVAAPQGTASISAMAVIGDFVEYGAIAYGDDESRIFISDDRGQTFTSTGAESLFSYRVDTMAFAPDYRMTGELYASSQDGIFRYGTARDLAAGEAAQEMAAAVEATRVARATAVAGLEFVPQQSDRVETGCIAYSLAPACLLMVFALRKGYPNDRRG
jgi:photosystem II stability/assembly factor-like uncharacterized protein